MNKKERLEDVIARLAYNALSHRVGGREIKMVMLDDVIEILTQIVKERIIWTKVKRLK